MICLTVYNFLLPPSSFILDPFMFFLNALVIVSSVILCCLLYLLRLPGMELLGITPNWLLIWLIAWSVKRSIWQAAIAGVALGWIYDGLSVGNPSHVLSLVTVGVITASLNKERYLGEDFVSMALIVFVMAIMAETIFALQYVWLQIRSFSDVWQDYLRITTTSAVITSLWTPAIYAPLNRWWEMIAD
ncbi:rod shape-determining protein MreD [Hyella patelloides]|nr:rod shape-determining protein MreD [Hyella patelloides]